MGSLYVTYVYCMYAYCPCERKKYFQSKDSLFSFSSKHKQVRIYHLFARVVVLRISMKIMNGGSGFISILNSDISVTKKRFRKLFSLISYQPCQCVGLLFTMENQPKYQEWLDVVIWSYNLSSDVLTLQAERILPNKRQDPVSTMQKTALAICSSFLVWSDLEKRFTF